MRKIRCFYWQIVGNLLYWIVVRYAADIGLIFEDISCWMHHRKMETTKRKGFCELLMCPEFCSVFLYRLRDGNNKIIFHLSKLILKEEKTLFITPPKIGGGGLYIMHGFATIISAKAIGRNCTIYQQVTLGHTDETHHVTLGNHVTIYAGVIAIGDITIGDNSEIGAGAVVVKSVPESAIAVGNPAKVIRIKTSVTNW